MKYNLLKMTQLILSSMDSDEINSIGDTTESIQVVDAIETTYYDLASTIDFVDHWDFFELESAGDVTKPTLMKLPPRVAKLEWLKYDITEDGGTVRNSKSLIPMPREMFFDRMDSLDTVRDDIYSYDLMVGSASIDIRGYSNREPSYFTTTDDRTIVIDNYDKDVGQTIIANRTRAYGMIIPEFIRQDDFIPDFEPRQFTLLFNEAKSQCFVDLKQSQNAKAEQRARRGWVQAHRKEPQIETEDPYRSATPAMGRGGRRGSRAYSRIYRS